MNKRIVYYCCSLSLIYFVTIGNILGQIAPMSLFPDPNPNPPTPPENSIVSIEYFIDEDPGVGNGITVDVEDATVIDGEFEVPVAGLENGFHTLFVRLRNEKGVVSQYSQALFYKTRVIGELNTNLQAIEYFVDDDPGVGNGTRIEVSDSASIDQVFDIPVASFSTGFHSLFVRVQNGEGTWNQYSRTLFYKTAATGDGLNTNLQAIEYFVDQDPGIGNATRIEVTDSTNIDQIFDIPVESLDNGFHSLFVRVQNGEGVWNQYSQALFYKTKAEGDLNNDIVALEYFFDEDPGIGMGDTISITPSKSVEQIFEIDVDALSKGFHSLFVRVQNGEGVWNQYSRGLFYVVEGTVNEVNEIVALEYFFNNATENKQVIDFDNQGKTVEQNLNFDISSLDLGENQLHVRVQNSNGWWSSYAVATFEKTDLEPHTLTFEAFEEKVYGDFVFSPSVTSDQDAIVTLASSDDNIASIDEENNITIHGAGEVTITATSEGNDTYVPAPITEQVLTIAKADLTVSVSDQGVEYGEQVSSNALNYDGFVNEDDESDLEEIPTVTTEASDSSNVGTYAVVLSEVEDKNYNVITEDGTIEITPAPLYAIASSDTISYGSTLPTFTVDYTGFKRNDNRDSITIHPMITTTLDSIVNVGTYAIALGNGEANNYVFDYTDGLLEITPVTLKVSPMDTSKVYGDTIPSTLYSYSGFVNEEDESVVTTMPVISSSVTSLSPVGTYEITGSGAEATNYIFEYDTATLSVTPASLVLSTDSISKVYGDTLPAFTITGEGFVGDDDMSSLSEAASVITTATSSSNVGNYALTLSGGSADNYIISYGDEASLTITPALATVVVNPSEKIYGDSLPSFTYNVEGLVNNDENLDANFEISYTTEATPLSNVGNYDVQASGTEVSNYTLSYSKGELSILPATIQVQVKDTSMVYGSQLPEMSLAYAGFVNDEDENILLAVPSITTEATSLSSVGIYALTSNGAEATNYTFEYDTASFTITPASLVLSTENTSKVYGAEMPSFTITGEGFVGSDDISVLTEAASVTTDATSESNVGDYALTVSGGLADNYSISYGDESTLSITPASATLTVDNSEKVYGEALPEFTYQVEGLVNNDASLGGTVEFSTDATEGSDAGTYPISATTNAIENYIVTVVNGELEILKAEQEIEGFISDQTINLTEESLTLSATATSGLEVSYTSSDESVVSIDGVIANLLVNGEVTITALQGGNQNYNAASSLEALLTVEGSPTSILDEYVFVKVYPNPATNYFVLDEAIESIQIFDTQGRTVKTFTSTSSKYDISTLSSGNYALLIATKSGAKQYSKLIVK